jgi:3-hydroxyanthranilate 3,4-dioxygenase
MNRAMPAINLMKWIEENRDLLKPPTGNKMIWEDRNFMILVVAGPNSRGDFHINNDEEFYYQLEGDMHIRVREDGKTVNYPVRAGEMFLLPAGIPHSPQRAAGTLGMLVLRRRPATDTDGFAWFCEECDAPMYEEHLHMTNFASQLPPLFDRFYKNPEHSTCKQCGTRAKPP